MSHYSLICPFLTDNPQFAHGVEFGLLYARMQSQEERISDYFHKENQDQILLLASRQGWYVREMKSFDKSFDKYWFWCVLEKL